VKGALQFLNLPVLGDAIFGKSDFVRGMEKLSKSKLSAAKSVGVAAIRIPVEWSFADIKQNFPLTTSFTKLKLFQTRPKAIIEMAILLANFRLCFRGENATTYFGFLPPKFSDYVAFGS